MTTGITRDELIAELFNKGFKPQSTASPKWKNAFFYTNGHKTLYVLVRTRGIDLLETRLKREDMINENGLLSVSMHREGDRFVEYGYTDSQLSIHRQVIDVAAMFVQQGEIEAAYFQRVGIGAKEWGEKYGEKSKRQHGTDAGSLSELYHAVSGEDDEPAYLGDGIWISPLGKPEDRG